MLKDIQTSEIPSIAIAAIQEFNENQIPEWYIYFINYSSIHLKGVLISSKGWGEINGEEKETSVLRHFLDQVDAMSYTKVEAIQPEVFGLYNQYWMSAYANENMIDFKFIFEPNTIDEINFEMVGLINQKGIILYAEN